MICKNCGKITYHTWSFIRNGKLHSDYCDTCYPEGKINTWSKIEKIKSRTLAPDGRTVLTGNLGMKMRDMKLRKHG